MAHLRLRNPHIIVSWIHPEWFTLRYGISTAFSRKLLLNKSCCTMKSSQHYHVNSSWIVKIWIRNPQNIVTWTPPEWMAHVGIWNNHSVLSWRFNQRSILTWIPCTMDSSQNSHVNSLWIVIAALWTHHMILTWTPPEWPMLYYGIITAFSR
jgi:hypothetical protein